MKTNKKNIKKEVKQIMGSGGAGVIDQVWDKSWTYIKTVVDIVHEPILILDKNLCVMAANGPFYRTFQVESKDTENKVVYELGNGQWNIPALRKLLEDILPKNTFFKGFEVTHNFPFIGEKVMMLNAREIHFTEDKAAAKCPPIILLAMEDITEMMTVAKTIAIHTHDFEIKIVDRFEKIETEINRLKKRP